MVQSIPLGHSTISRREAHAPYHGFTLGCAQLLLSERGCIPHAGEMGQAVCTPPGYQAGQPLNKADRAGGMRLRWLTFENSKEQDEARTAAPPFSC